jgi:hypothetical protein
VSAPVRIVGIMLAKDEADAVPDVIPPLVRALDALYYFAADAETARAIHKASPPGWARAVSPPDIPPADGLRRYLLEAARYDRAIDRDTRPMWVMVVQGDEIYHDDLREYVLRAHAAGACVMTCQVATFLIHESQREGWDWTLPLDKRLTHYICDFGEHTGFLDSPFIYYEASEHMRAHPHGLPEGKIAYSPARPVRKHYPFRSPEQARKRIEDRLKSGWQPHYWNYKDVFMSEEAAGRPIFRFNGIFPRDREGW